MSVNASTYTPPASIPTLAGSQKVDYTKVQNEQMGQKEFLTLFTTQLKNQNPLDPMQNEQFVAQLAQFSQLEATTNMSTNLNTLIATLKGQQLLNGSALIGKQVAVPNGPAILKNGAPISGVISVPEGARAVNLSVYDASGVLVKSQELGRQLPGDVTVRWDGTDNAGTKMTDGSYKVVATVTGMGGTVTKVPIATPDVVKGVTMNSDGSDLVIETQSGATVNFSQVKQIKG